MKKMVIFGATSAIAMETAKLFADEGSEFVLLARDGQRLAVIAGDLQARGAGKVELITADLSVIDQHQSLFEQIREKMPDFDTVLFAYGSLGNQEACQADYGVTEKELTINFLSVVSWLTLIANHFEAKREGTIAVITSVAGDRGRQSNYIYGCAKGALTIFLQGLRNRLYLAGVRVLNVKPGFVDTPMTAGLKKGVLFVKPQIVARGIRSAIVAGRNTVYLPWFWRIIMFIICSIPEGIFKRLKL